MDQSLVHNIGLTNSARQIFDDMCARHPQEKHALQHTLQNHPFLKEILPDFLQVFSLLIQGFQAGHTLFLCGNGGSFADSIHIAGELMKAFRLKRPLSESDKLAFSEYEFNDILSEHLEKGLPCIALGLNPSLVSATQNDTQISAIQYAQELYALGKKGDMLLGISTSGNALNVRYAISTAEALGMTTLGLTGRHGGKLAEAAYITIQVPATETYMVQEQHEIVYHALCLLLELRFFADREQGSKVAK
jgi:D-sedoheptulose 7-phosphate isomerase